MKHPRTAIAGLSLSAAALVALVAHEGYTDNAVIPVKGDVPTYGFGSTTHADGSPVRMGESTNPVAALQRTLLYTQETDRRIKACVTAPLYPAEYDLLSDFAYQYGFNALCKSSMVRLVNSGDYVGSCKAYLQYRFVSGYDCSTLINGKPNKQCWGVWERSKERAEKCLALQ